ncbi:MAG: class I SAM-dependent methyltransferase [Pseudomonadota bacterium]
MENSGLEKIRIFKRLAWQNAKSVQRYSNVTERPCVGKKRERDITGRFAKGIILDAGAGAGRISRHLKALAFTVFPLDLSLGMLAHQKDCLPCTCGDAEDLPFMDNTFDTVIAVWLLLHFPNWKDILGELIRVLKAGGTLLFDVSSKEHLEWAKGYSPYVDEKYSTPERFEAFVCIEELAEFLEEKGMRLEEVIPYDYLNSNELLQTLVDKWSTDQKGLKSLLVPSEVVDFWCWIEEEILSHLPPGLAHKNFIVARKSERDSPSNEAREKVFTSLDDAIKKALEVLDEKKGLLLSHLIGSLDVMTILKFYRKITEVLSPVLELDVVSIVKGLKKETLSVESMRKLDRLIKREFGYFAARLVTSWHEYPGQCAGSLYGVPIGPMAEYSLIHDMIKNYPEKILWDMEG